MSKIYRGIRHRLRTAWSIRRAGYGASKTKLFLLTLLIQIYAYFGVRSMQTISCVVAVGSRRAGIMLPATLENLEMLEDIFVDGDYEVPGDFRPKKILDLGGNIGLSAVWFSLRYPGAKIWVYEPNPVARTLLERNVAGLPVVVRDSAVAARPGIANFYVSSRSIASSLFSRQEEEAMEIKVHCLSLAQVIEDIGSIDLLKIDTEGAEYETLAAYTGKIPAIVGEFDARGGHTAEEMRTLLARGYMHIPAEIRNKSVFKAIAL